MPEQSKDFRGAFIATTSKLTRLDEVITTRLGNLEGDVIERQFNIESRNGKVAKWTSLEEVFGSDNPVNNPCQSLEIVSNKRAEGKLIGSIAIIIGVMRFTKESIQVRVSGTNGHWCSETYAEVEEQIERMIPKNPVYRLLQIDLFASFIFLPVFFGALAMAAVAILFAPSERVGPFDLHAKQVESLHEVAETADDDTKKIEFVFQYLQATLDPRDPVSAGSQIMSLLTNLFFYLIALPIVAVVGVLIYLAAVCYPKYVFEWGDYGEHHQQLIKRRGLLWNGMVIALVVGILGGLFVFGLTAFFPRPPS